MKTFTAHFFVFYLLSSILRVGHNLRITFLASGQKCKSGIGEGGGEGGGGEKSLKMD